MAGASVGREGRGDFVDIVDSAFCNGSTKGGWSFIFHIFFFFICFIFFFFLFLFLVVSLTIFPSSSKIRYGPKKEDPWADWRFVVYTCYRPKSDVPAKKLARHQQRFVCCLFVI